MSVALALDARWLCGKSFRRSTLLRLTSLGRWRPARSRACAAGGPRWLGLRIAGSHRALIELHGHDMLPLRRVYPVLRAGFGLSANESRVATGGSQPAVVPVIAASHFLATLVDLQTRLDFL